MFQFLEILPEIFIVMGLLLVLLELIIGIEAGFDLVLIGSILMISGFGGLATDNYSVALVIAIVLSVFYIFYGRSLVKNKFNFKPHKSNVDGLIGKDGIVVEPITPLKAGVVRVDDESWRARSDETLAVGETVSIQSLSGVTVTVRKI